MARRFLDADLRAWEVYANPGRFGAPRPAHINFHCVSEFAVGSRYVERDVDRAEAERALRAASVEDLREWLEEAEPVSQSGSASSRLPQPMS